MRTLALLLLAALTAPPALAEGERAGDFDYYVLSLSWSPTWCALTGDARGADQCDPRHDFGFTLHGLWPQYDLGWPGSCRTRERPPTRAETAAMADIMGSGGLAWHEWKKHGTCSGLAAADYFALARRAYEGAAIPDYFRALHQTLRVDAAVVEDAFLEADPALDRNMVTVTCERGMIDEVRLCLTRDLEPRACGDDAARDCRMKGAVMEKIR
jgi:ribonuclease T2